MAERSGKIARCWAFSFIGTFYWGFAGDFSIFKGLADPYTGATSLLSLITLQSIILLLPNSLA